MRALRFTTLVVGVALSGCNCGLEVLEIPKPHMKVSPQQVVLNAPVAQDTRIVIQVLNDSIVTLEEFNAELTEDSDPNFELIQDFDSEVFPGATDEITIIVRPLVTNTINAVLRLTAEEDAQPRPVVEVPLIVTGIDAGLPDICDYPESINFGLVGRNDVAREAVLVRNCGVRDLIIDNAYFCATPADGEVPDDRGCGADESIRLTTVIGTGDDAPKLVPTASVSLDLVFNPLDLLEHTGELVIESNDPDELQVRIPVTGKGQQCPTACAAFVDDPTEFEPFDIVRITGNCSLGAEGGALVGGFEWRLIQRPLGSQALPIPSNSPNTEVEADLAGHYVVQLEVTEAVEAVAPDGSIVVNDIRGCEPAQVEFDVIPDEELLIQLVWDHPDADFDLHLLHNNGAPFVHDNDCYFSNRNPPETCGTPCPSWSANADENPSLDHDDSRGYGPENTTVVAPGPLSQWRILVHYWNAQTDGDARAEATVRVFVYGTQAIEVSRVFEEDEQLWEALEIVWSDDPEGLEPPSISQLGVVTPFPRPF